MHRICIVVAAVIVVEMLSAAALALPGSPLLLSVAVGTSVGQTVEATSGPQSTTRAFWNVTWSADLTYPIGSWRLGACAFRWRDGAEGANSPQEIHSGFGVHLGKDLGKASLFVKAAANAFGGGVRFYPGGGSAGHSGLFYQAEFLARIHPSGEFLNLDRPFGNFSLGYSF